MRAASGSGAAARTRTRPQRTCAGRESGAVAAERACTARRVHGARAPLAAGVPPRLCIASRRLRCGCALAPSHPECAGEERAVARQAPPVRSLAAGVYKSRQRATSQRALPAPLECAPRSSSAIALERLRTPGMTQNE